MYLFYLVIMSRLAQRYTQNYTKIIYCPFIFLKTSITKAQKSEKGRAGIAEKRKNV